MATVAENGQDDNENEQGGSNQNGSGSSSPTSVASASPSTTGSSTGGSTSSGGGSSKSASTGSTYNPSAPTSSGNFTNLKSYLGANNNGQDFSNQVNSNLQQQGSNLNSNIQGASNQFNNQVQSVVNPAQQNYQSYQNIANNNDPNAITNYASQGNNAQNIQNLENSTYTGPQNLNNLSGNYNGNALQSGVSNYQNLANDTTSDAGRMNLLQSLYGNSNYNQGQQTLDNVFLQGNNFSNTVGQANQVNNAYNTANNNASATVQNAQNALGNIASGTQNSLNTAMSNENQAIQGNYANALNTQAQDYTQLQKDLTGNSLTQQEFTELGLTPGQSLYGVNPVAQNLIQNVALTPQNTASAQNYSTIAALNSLLGNNANTQSTQLASQYASPTQQVTNYQNDPNLAAAITAAQTQYNNQAGADVDQANNYINNTLNPYWGENVPNEQNTIFGAAGGVRRTDQANQGSFQDVNAQTNAADWAAQQAANTGYNQGQLMTGAAGYNSVNSAIQQLAALQAQYGIFNPLTLQGAAPAAPTQGSS